MIDTLGLTWRFTSITVARTILILHALHLLILPPKYALEESPKKIEWESIVQHYIEFGFDKWDKYAKGRNHLIKRIPAEPSAVQLVCGELFSYLLSSGLYRR